MTGTPRLRFSVWTSSVAALGLVLWPGCGGRAGYWSAPVDSTPPTFALPGAVALLDTAATRVVLLTPGPDQSLATTPIPVGTNILNAALSPDGRKLFVVSGGHRAEIGDDQPDEPPSLTVIDPSQAPPAQKFVLATLTDPLAGLAIDPAGRWVVLYAGSGTNQPFVANRNRSRPPTPSRTR
jgi:hypothetical protein